MIGVLTQKNPSFVKKSVDRQRAPRGGCARSRRTCWCAGAGAPARAGTRACAPSAGSGRSPGSSTRPSTSIVVGLDLERLALALALHERAARDQRSTRREAQHLGRVVRERVRRHDLQRALATAVRDLHERDARLAVAARADPAADFDLAVGGYRPREHLLHTDYLHARTVPHAGIAFKQQPARRAMRSPAAGCGGTGAGHAFGACGSFFRPENTFAMPTPITPRPIRIGFKATFSNTASFANKPALAATPPAMSPPMP
jgi:hypothetical protein